MRRLPIIFAFYLSAVGLCAESLQELVDYAIYHHPLLCAEAEHVSVARAQRGEAAAAFYPELYVIGGAQEESLNVRDDSYTFGYISLRWNLFRGGKDRALLATACKEEAVRCCELEQTLQEVIRNIFIAYYELLHAQRVVKVYQDAHEYLANFASDAARKRDAGLETAVDGSEIEYHRVHYGALLRQAQAKAEIALADLQLAVGDSCGELNWEIEGNFLAAEELPSLESLSAAAYCQRSERAVAEHRQDAQSARLQAVRAERWPQVDLVGNWGKENEVQSDRGVGTRAAVVASIPLFQGGRVRHRQCREKAELRRQQQLACQLDHQIATQVRRAYQNVQSIYTHLEVVDKISRDRDSFLDAVRDEYQRGIRNSGDVVAGIAFMVEMETERIDGWRDYSVARTDLAWATGDVFAIFHS